MVFEVGTATMMAAKGAIKPMYQLMDEAGVEFNPEGFIGPVKGYYTTTSGEMLSMPYNSSTPVLWVNRDAFKKAGLNNKIETIIKNKMVLVLSLVFLVCSSFFEFCIYWHVNVCVCI